MYHKLVAVIIALVTTTMSQASAGELNSAELKSLFSDTTVNWTNKKGNKITLSLNSDGSAKGLIVTPQRKVRREGKWWIKEPNIHCVKWVKRNKNTCRRIGNVEESGEGWTTNRKGITWTITKRSTKDENNLGSDDSKKFQEQIAGTLKLMVAEIMKIVPKQLDPVTVLSSASSNQDTLTYNYILDLEKDDIDSSMVSNYRKSLLKQLCSNKPLKLMMKVGAKFKYSYVGKSGSRLLEYTFGKEECV